MDPVLFPSKNYHGHPHMLLSVPSGGTSSPVSVANVSGIAIGIIFGLFMLLFLVLVFLFLFCGKDRIRFYKKNCGHGCAIFGTRTNTCMNVTLTNCFTCLALSKRCLWTCYDCCCPVCGHGAVKPDDSDVVQAITIPPDVENTEQLPPLPPSVEEVDNVDSKGNPRRLPPIETPKDTAAVAKEAVATAEAVTAAATAEEVDDSGVPRSLRKLPPIQEPEGDEADAGGGKGDVVLDGDPLEHSTPREDETNK